ncbi:hypothetical protein [Allosphingosinicella sp.]|jgi:hypothetical protein|uniref:hypothetical protein n=1 Tax=Allosphingosinicella sp. TaxID=2823234 RepID=UPI002EF8400B
MRKFLIPLAAAAIAVSAAPAAAQYRGHGYQQGPTRSVQIERQLEQLRDRIRRAEDRDIISDREEDRLLRRLGNIAQRYDRFRRNGLSRSEQNELHRDIQDLRQRLRSERREERWDDRRDRDGRRW